MVWLLRLRWAVSFRDERTLKLCVLIDIGDNWNAFGCDVSEELLLQTGQLIVDYGLKDLGYHYGMATSPRKAFLFPHFQILTHPK